MAKRRMRPATAPASALSKNLGRTYELRIALENTNPSIWRRFLVAGDIRLDHFHYVLQTVMGWTNSHLHEFRMGKRRLGPPDPEGDDFGEKCQDEAGVALEDVLTKPKQSVVYDYDFGDGWSHVITLLAIRFVPCLKLACLDGARACPPEDCGGPGGYEHLLEVISDSTHEEYDMRAWFKSMTPRRHLTEVFPIAKVNKEFSKGLKSLVEHYEQLAGFWDNGVDEALDDEADDDRTIKFPLRN